MAPGARTAAQASPPLSRRLSLWAILLLGCGAGGPRQRCELEPERRVARSAGLSFDGIAVAADGPRREAWFAWSEAGGVWLKRAGAAPARIGARCPGGIDLQTDAARAWLACSRPAADETESEVVLYELDRALETRALHALGRAGRDGRGVALALDRGGVQVAFHEGSIGEHAVWLASLRAGAQRLRRLSRPGRAAGEPALVAHAGHLFASFRELELDLSGEGESTIWLARDRAPARRVLRARVPDPAPKLTADARGLVLAYRDRKRAQARSALYVVRLDASAKFASAPRAVGRANAEGDPGAYGCGAITVALSPREYGSERFVGVNALDGELAPLGVGHQFYASGREFVLASAACLERGWLVLAADRAAPGKPGVEAVALRFRCAE